MREYSIVAIELPIQYNKAGWHDPQGRIFVLEEDEERCISRKKGSRTTCYMFLC